MVHTVGIAGANGNVGAPTVKLLARAATEGRIKLVVFHRDGSVVKDISPGKDVEFRVLNYDDPSEKIESALAGINVFISAVAFSGLPYEPRVVEALAKTGDLVTYIPSTFSTTWEKRDFDDEQLGPVLNFIHTGWHRALELGLNVTPLYIGAFENYWFEVGFIGSPLKGNTIWANEKQLRNRIPITMRDHVAAALTQIATSPPQTVAGKAFSAVTFWPTGQELVELYTRLNGTQAHVKQWTTLDRDTMRADGANFGPAKVGYWDRWESGNWGYEKPGRVALEGYSGPGLEEVGRRFV